jgi:hypothetical protein
MFTDRVADRRFLPRELTNRGKAYEKLQNPENNKIEAISNGVVWKQ